MVFFLWRAVVVRRRENDGGQVTCVSPSSRGFFHVVCVCVCRVSHPTLFLLLFISVGLVYRWFMTAA